MFIYAMSFIIPTSSVFDELHENMYKLYFVEIYLENNQFYEYVEKCENNREFYNLTNKMLVNKYIYKTEKKYLRVVWN